eukprot:scaffold1763_cov211-Pinguiococcus_pyrenoidosus.AAC.2
MSANLTEAEELLSAALTARRAPSRKRGPNQEPSRASLSTMDRSEVVAVSVCQLRRSPNSRPRRHAEEEEDAPGVQGRLRGPG